MFFSVASPDWKPGQPLAPAGALLFRTEAEAASFAPDAAVVAVSVRYDGKAQALRPQGLGASGLGQWSTQAVGNRLGGLTVFGLIPASLIHPGPESRPSFEVEVLPGECYGWDSLTMALLA